MNFALSSLTLATSLLAVVAGTAQAQSQDTPPAPQSDAPVQAPPAPPPVTGSAWSREAKRMSDALGVSFWGYARGGFYAAQKGAPRGGYSLGGDLQKFRLGNEGDNDLEFGIGKKFDLGGGVQWGVFYMPQVYQGDYRTAQAYTTLSGLGFAPTVSFWAGQRYRRLADIHIVDHFLLEDGDNYGAGVDGIALGGAGKLNLSVHNSDSTENKAGNPNNAKRVNLQWTGIPVNPGGTLTVTAGVIRGNFAIGSDGGAVGVMHKQAIVPGFNNSLFVQASTGHATLSGKFYHLDDRSSQTSLAGLLNPDGSLNPNAQLVTTTVLTPRAGARQRRIADAIDFQFGPVGGQALVGYQTLRPDGGAEVRDFSLGGRVSYGVAPYVKLLGELGTTRRSIDGQPKQSLHKGTVAVALSPDIDFWTRPEVRLYATRASWNSAAQQANAGSFGANGRRHATLFGVQMEAWWE